MLTITSTIKAFIVIVVVIYAKKSDNCSCGKHLQNNRKNKNTNLDDIELKEISKPHGISTFHPLMCRLTANSCYSLVQRQLPQLPNVIQDKPDSPLLHSSLKDSAYVHNTCLLKVRESPKMKFRQLLNLLKTFLEVAGFNFCKYDKFKHAQRRIIDPS